MNEPVDAAVPAREAGRARRSWAPWVAALVLALLVAVSLVVRARAKPADLQGVRLGMTARDVRARFDALGPGTWDSRVGEDLVLSWHPSAATARAAPLAATFEFHLGVLMAVRAELPKGDPAGAGPAFEITDSTVVVREGSDKGPTKLTMIARSCPIHRAEAEALVAGRRR